MFRQQQQQIITSTQQANLKSPQQTKSSVVDAQVKEYFKCQMNVFYFIFNYVYIEETGGRFKLRPENLNKKMRRVIMSLNRYHNCVLMASRQLGKSTIAACMLIWAMLFFPRIKCVILNMRKKAALENLDRMKFIWDNLPDWMKIPRRSKSDIKTYFELINGSRVDVFYPSSTHDPSTLARSLTIPILYIDEAAFIHHMLKIYGSAQQTLSKAREQARKNNYPFFQLVTSTPNGVYGDGEWFYKRYTNGIDSDQLFEFDDENKFELWKDPRLVSTQMNDMTKNSFIRVRYHWREDITKDEAWYTTQCRELDDERLINQELDLVFVGSTSCVFSDKILSEFQKEDVIATIPAGTTELEVFTNIDPTDYYLIGVDSASSIKGAYDAIEIFSFANFIQVAELQVKLGSLTKYSDLVAEVFQWLYQIVGNRIILCIENNSIGKAVIEGLLNKDFNYSLFIYDDNDNDRGINTNTKTKELQFARFYQYVRENPECINSETLIAQLATIERTNSGLIKSKTYSDLFMAACFCAYVRAKKSLDILPLLGETSLENTKKQSKELIDQMRLNNVKQLYDFSTTLTIKQDSMIGRSINDSQANTVDNDFSSILELYGSDINSNFDDNEDNDNFTFF